MVNVDCLILGGGVTGLSFANFYKGDFIILEKDKELGGYCKTTIVGDYVWDYSGHFFHFVNEEIEKFITKNIQCDILKVKKRSKIFYKSNHIDFPFQFNIHQLNKDEFIDCLYDLYKVDKSDKIYSNFQELSYCTFGKSISDKFIIPYNSKLYACDLKKLDHDCMGRFISKSKFEEVIESSAGLKIKTYNDSFIYPKNGCYEFIKSILYDIDESKIKLNTEVYKIDLSNKTVFTNNGEFKFNRLISTIPFNTFLKLSNDCSNVTLSSNKVVVFNIGFDKPSNVDSHWIYFPGDEIFYRVGFYDNILDSDKMSIYVEIGMPSDQNINEEDLLNNIIEDLKRTKIITNQNIIDHQMLVMNPAYVHITKESNKFYEKWCDENNRNGVYSIGRYGSWTYCSIEDNIIQAKKIAEII